MRRNARTGQHFLDAIGGPPEECTLRQPEVTGRLGRGPSVIEKPIYRSLPEFYVTAPLYLVKERPTALARGVRVRFLDPTSGTLPWAGGRSWADPPWARPA
ncbi:MAG: hypothetical protein HY320_03470 [Armatimonadetes bacterium]|nr:hypothetical protein [Armatimonadota bacterium]